MSIPKAMIVPIPWTRGRQIIFSFLSLWVPEVRPDYIIFLVLFLVPVRLCTQGFRAECSPCVFGAGWVRLFFPWRPRFDSGSVFWYHSSPDSRALLDAVAGSRKALLCSPDICPSSSPEPTLTVLWSADCQSLATSFCSRNGRLTLVWSTCLVQ